MPNTTVTAAGEAMPKNSTQTELPVDQVERLARELSEALPQWVNGQFMAMVYPAGDIRGFWFRNARNEDSKPVDPRARLREITNEAAMLIATNPDMNIDHITVDKDGIYTGLRFSGFDTSPRDPLLDVIDSYRAGLIEFNRLTADERDDKRWPEHGAATYEPWQVALDDWSEPARTCEGAIEALRAALSEQDGVRGSVAADRLVKAALEYLEGVRA